MLLPALAALWWMRPVTLGGDTAYVIVAGNSMRPTYAPGDLVVTRAKSKYIAGDIVLYRVPKDQPGEGLRVIHRIVDVNTDGTYVTQGDNRDRADEWTPRAENVEGKPRYIVRGLGIWLRKLLEPHVLAVVMALSVVWATWPSPRRRSRRRSASRDLAPDADAVEAIVVYEPWERREPSLAGRH
ncbi:MAG TPA: signal peptidase I [Acidimicrobiia bacterium]|nr:signal peptidase I [Acidimicrobiia bacterium]